MALSGGNSVTTKEISFNQCYVSTSFAFQDKKGDEEGDKKDDVHGKLVCFVDFVKKI